MPAPGRHPEEDLPLPGDVTITDVVLRDGLQDEPVVVAVPDRVAVAAALAAAGVRAIEAASFVNPARVPQMAGAEELFAALPRGGRVRYSALALNARGVARAVAADVDEIVLVVSAGQGHSLANAGRGAEEVLAGLRDAVAGHPGAAFTGAVSTAFTCPFDGEIPPHRLLDVARGLAGMGVTRMVLADTLGTTRPERIARTLAAVRAALPDVEFGLHLHDASGQALDTVDAALELGVTRFDAAAGGYGGCPFAPGAHGNLATERLVAHLHSRGVRTGIDEDALADAVSLVRKCLARGTPLT
ncbi:hydroxymethylglutaryl-CoA lyase [Nonomuraea longispora]|uniref:Hydroxymethylglutaryl-CoA lyase n=1 Tax=Nonomuraea longispora TaxID=1848320 RepID=A0A4R4NH27_9ACTN|nr:hydroxymethylglutaryl-CoA lyase [Nonomuraea longispora]TDC06933.1 hydroxymethylglutaryl-CoA lyase [Nonomuraea longispora]